MNTWLANEAVESLKDYTQMVEDEYAVRGKCSFYTWKPENIVVDKSCTPGSSLTFNMVDIETCEFQGRITVWGFSHFRNGIEEIAWLYFFMTFANGSQVTFNVPYDCNACDTIGEYIYKFVDEVDMLTMFRDR